VHEIEWIDGMELLEFTDRLARTPSIARPLSLPRNASRRHRYLEFDAVRPALVMTLTECPLCAKPALNI